MLHQKLITFTTTYTRRAGEWVKITRVKLNIFEVILKGQTGKSDANIESKLMTSKIEV